MTNKSLSGLSNYLTKITGKKEMLEILESLLTIDEQDDIPKRLEIALFLRKGKTQEKVAQEVGAAKATISRVAQKIKMGYFKNLK